jgi:hypothetical protein
MAGSSLAHVFFVSEMLSTTRTAVRTARRTLVEVDVSIPAGAEGSEPGAAAEGRGDSHLLTRVSARGRGTRAATRPSRSPGCGAQPKAGIQRVRRVLTMDPNRVSRYTIRGTRSSRAPPATGNIAIVL